MPSSLPSLGAPPAASISNFASSESTTGTVHLRCTAVKRRMYQSPLAASYGAAMSTDREILEYVLGLAAEQGMNQVELGEALGIGRAAVTNWNAKGRVPDKQLKPLSLLLGKSVDQILAAGKEVVVIRHAGDRMRFARRMRKLTVEEVAEAAGMTAAEYRRCEEHGILPPTKQFLELATVLQVADPHWLAQGDPVLVESGKSKPGRPKSSDSDKAGT
jgi:hypothetical protein